MIVVLIRVQSTEIQLKSKVFMTHTSTTCERHALFISLAWSRLYDMHTCRLSENMFCTVLNWTELNWTTECNDSKSFTNSLQRSFAHSCETAKYSARHYGFYEYMRVVEILGDFSNYTRASSSNWRFIAHNVS